MKTVRNREYLMEIIISGLVTITAAAVCLFFSPLCALIVFAAGVIITVVHYIFCRKRYERISDLSQSIDRILHGQEEFLISDSSEGELAILENEIRKMTLRLKEQTGQLKADKVHLTGAIEDIFHQLRTPLTSMNLVVSLLSAEDLDYVRRVQLTRQLKKQLERMQWMIETLLKMSKIDAGTAIFRKERVYVRDVIAEALQPFLIPAELNEQNIITETADESFEGDMSWTVEAVSNLIKNCIEHTPEGGAIRICTLETVLSTDITISDNGEGFCREDLPYLFERFYKGQNASKDSIGIGLAFSRMVIAEQNGTLTADNIPGGGARFTIRFYKSVI